MLPPLCECNVWNWAGQPISHMESLGLCFFSSGAQEESKKQHTLIQHWRCCCSVQHQQPTHCRSCIPLIPVHSSPFQSSPVRSIPLCSFHSFILSAPPLCSSCLSTPLSLLLSLCSSSLSTPLSLCFSSSLSAPPLCSSSLRLTQDFQLLLLSHLLQMNFIDPKLGKYTSITQLHYCYY